MLKKERKITLVSIVVTIIVLIILTVLSINILTGKNLVINIAKEEKITKAKAKILEELQLVKSHLITIEGNEYIDLDKYIEYIKEEGLNKHNISITDGDSENTKLLIVDEKYLYTVEQKENNIVINEIGYKDNLIPIIDYFTVKSTTESTITVSVSAKMAEEYEFCLGEEVKGTAKRDDNTAQYQNEKKEYTYTNLEEGKTYQLKLRVKNANGDKTQSISYTLGLVGNLKETDIAVTPYEIGDLEIKLTRWAGWAEYVSGEIVVLSTPGTTISKYCIDYKTMFDTIARTYYSDKPQFTIRLSSKDYYYYNPIFDIYAIDSKGNRSNIVSINMSY